MSGEGSKVAAENADGGSDGMGMERPQTTPGFSGEGSEQKNSNNIKRREEERFRELESKAFGRDTEITNSGIPLESFGGAGYSDK